MIRQHGTPLQFIVIGLLTIAVSPLLGRLYFNYWPGLFSTPRQRRRLPPKQAAAHRRLSTISFVLVGAVLAAVGVLELTH